MTFGKVIKLARVNSDLTQKDVAKRMNISQSTYSRLENNKQTPSIYHLKKIRDCLNISLDGFLDKTI